VVRDLPALGERNLTFIPMNQFFKPDFIAVVMRKDKILSSYKSGFINILFGREILPRNSS
jgi:hypothetical protein